VYVCDPQYVDLCSRELGLRQTSTDGILTLPAGALRDPCFAHQVLPAAKLLESRSGTELAAAVLSHVEALIPGATVAAERIHVSTPELQRQRSDARQAHPLDSAAQALAQLLAVKATGRAAKKALTAAPHTLRVLLVHPGSAWVSLRLDPAAPLLLAWPSPRIGGQLLDERARDAPSSAWRKLAEALLLLDADGAAGPGVGDTVVDLGAAPGGFTRVMLERGARVIAIDRADLDDELERDPRVAHWRQDAFSVAPSIKEPVQWWLCDVIDAPQRTLGLARKVLARPDTRGLVFTLKLKRPLDTALLDEARDLARDTPGYLGRVKQLRANKLEVSLLMRRVDAAPRAG
jgi:23S rRNA C2498 (ribose-2'-O)-methylase RlmM